MSGIRHSTATYLKILADRDDEWAVRMAMIERAQRFLIVTTYYFGCDDLSGTMMEALTAAAQRGVRVVLLLDRFGQRLGQQISPRPERAVFIKRLQTLRAAGGFIAYYSPKSLMHRFVGGGMHVKIQVSEAGSAVFGSSNIAHHSFRKWNEVSLEIKGEIVADLLEEACRFAALPADDAAALIGMLPEPLNHQNTQSLRYLREDPAERTGRFFPFGELHNRLTAEIVAMIDRAQNTLSITSFYYKPAPILKAALLRACRRGVDVEIFHSHRDSLEASPLPWISSTFQYASIIEAGGRIYENYAGEHSKIVLVDGREVAVGSYNFEHAAHDRLIEAMVFSDDAALCEDFSAFFTGLRRSPSNTALAPEWVSALPFVLRMKRWLYRPLQRWI
jgi:cardiolipin synthase A/B